MTLRARKIPRYTKKYLPQGWSKFANGESRFTSTTTKLGLIVCKLPIIALVLHKKVGETVIT